MDENMDSDEPQDEAPKKSWKDRLFGGLKKSSSKLSGNITGLVTKAKLDDATLDDIEEALIVSDLGPETAMQIRDKISTERFWVTCWLIHRWPKLMILNLSVR